MSLHLESSRAATVLKSSVSPPTCSQHSCILIWKVSRTWSSPNLLRVLLKKSRHCHLLFIATCWEMFLKYLPNIPRAATKGCLSWSVHWESNSSVIVVAGHGLWKDFTLSECSVVTFLPVIEPTVEEYLRCVLTKIIQNNFLHYNDKLKLRELREKKAMVTQIQWFCILA